MRVIPNVISLSLPLGCLAVLRREKQWPSRRTGVSRPEGRGRPEVRGRKKYGRKRIRPSSPGEASLVVKLSKSSFYTRRFARILTRAPAESVAVRVSFGLAVKKKCPSRSGRAVSSTFPRGKSFPPKQSFPSEGIQSADPEPLQSFDSLRPYLSNKINYDPPSSFKFIPAQNHQITKKKMGEQLSPL